MINNCGRFARCVTSDLHILITIIPDVSLIPVREVMTASVTLSEDLWEMVTIVLLRELALKILPFVILMLTVFLPEIIRVNAGD